MTNLVLQAAAGGSSMSFSHHDGSYLRYHVVLYDPSSAEEAEGNPQVPECFGRDIKVVTGGGVYGTLSVLTSRLIPLMLR